MVGFTGATAFSGLAFGTTPGLRVAGTDAVELKAGEVLPGEISANIATAAADTNISTSDVTGLINNDILIMCDYRGGVIFKLTGFTGVAPAAGTIQHTMAGSPGNIAVNLSKPQPTDPTLPPIWAVNGTIAKLRATRWYVACNTHAACDQPGGRSLVQAVLQNNAGTLTVVPTEIAQGIQGMTLQYLVKGQTSYAPASSLTTAAQWAAVSAVKVTLTLAGPDRAGTDGTPIVRTVQHVITLRNHLP
jgi:type IV pilus assembly protein PilW